MGAGELRRQRQRPLNALVRIAPADPQGPDALTLLRAAAVEARVLYPELFAADAPWPANPPLPERGAFLLATVDGVAAGCAALRPIDARTAEVRRVFVARDGRRRGVARVLMLRLEDEARRLGYARLQLETGHRQQPAMALYAALGYAPIAPFGPYVGDPTSVCFGKDL